MGVGRARWGRGAGGAHAATPAAAQCRAHLGATCCCGKMLQLMPPPQGLQAGFPHKTCPPYRPRSLRSSVDFVHFLFCVLVFGFWATHPAERRGRSWRCSGDPRWSPGLNTVSRVQGKRFIHCPPAPAQIG